VRREVTPARGVAAVAAAVALGAIFRFPVQVLLVLAFAGLGVVIVRRWRWGGLAGSTAFAAGFLAQATSIFVTPFTWWMRFTFFAVMLGALVLLIVWQTREL
jgi:preprotein translocase subunit SecG